MVILPLVIYIITEVWKRKILKRKQARKILYFKRIKNDYNNKVMDKLLIDLLNKQYEPVVCSIQEDKISIQNQTFSITFTKTKAMLEIKQTKVSFKYFYSIHFEDVSEYDIKHLQYHDQEYLYQLLLQRLEILSRNPLIYEENKKSCRLLSFDEKKILFQKKIKSKSNMKTTIIIPKIENNSK